MTRSVAIAVGVTVLVVAVVQLATSALSPISMAVAALAAGAVVGAMDRPEDVREIVVPGAIIGVVGMLTSALLMAFRGTNVLEPRFLAGWVFVAVLGLVLAGGVALLMGRVLPDAHA